MKVLGKNSYTLKPMEITAMKVLKALLPHAMLSRINTPPPPPEKKYVRGNQSPFMNKALSEAIM